MNLKGRSFLTLLDFNKDEIRYMLDLAHELKAKKKKGIQGEELKGKNIVLVFDKSSTRTRCSFEVAAMDEGAHVTYLTNSHMNKKESIEDTAKVFGRMYDAIEYRGFGQDIVEDLQKYSGVPVWNGLTDVDHPTQVLADFMTMEEHIDKKLDEMKLTFVGDLSDNVMYALMYGSAIMGVDFKAVGPKETVCDPKVLEVSQELAKKSGATITISHDPEDVKGSDVIYTDIWVSMGESEDLYPVRVNALSPYKVTTKMMKDTGNDKCLFLHCLPAYHDFETSVARKGKLFLEGLKSLKSKYSVIGDVDGLGLALRMEITQTDGITPNRELCDKLQEEGLKGDLIYKGKKCGLVLNNGGYYKNVITFVPSLYITDDEINMAIELLDQLFTRLEK